MVLQQLLYRPLRSCTDREMIGLENTYYLLQDCRLEME
jgi:hypothetical protein